MSRDRDEVERLRASLTLCKYTNDIRGKPCARFEEYSEARTVFKFLSSDVC